jgi:hypothetical protein
MRQFTRRANHKVLHYIKRYWIMGAPSFELSVIREENVPRDVHYTYHTFLSMAMFNKQFSSLNYGKCKSNEQNLQISSYWDLISNTIHKQATNVEGRGEQTSTHFQTLTLQTNRQDSCSRCSSFHSLKVFWTPNLSLSKQRVGQQFALSQ